MRRLLKVQIDDAIEADRVFTMLMGDEMEHAPRLHRDECAEGGEYRRVASGATIAIRTFLCGLRASPIWTRSPFSHRVLGLQRALLALTHFRGEQYRDQFVARGAGMALLLALAALQSAHFAFLQFDQAWTERAWYHAALFVVAPRSSSVQPEHPSAAKRQYARVDDRPACGAGPVAWCCPASLAMPLRSPSVRAICVAGAQALRLEGRRANFRLELLLLGVEFVGPGAAMLGVWAGAMPALVQSLYASAIGCLARCKITLDCGRNRRPRSRESAQAAYANTTPARVDCFDALARARRACAQSERWYVDPDLSSLVWPPACS